MTTLYELLGALPDDDAEGLRSAFRKAAKTAHPDTNPDDPDASLRFRQLVRAHDILSDDEQRAAYDQLLALAQLAPGSKSKSTIIYEAMHKIASNTIAATVISGTLVGGYALFGLAMEAPAVPDKTVEVVARQPIEVAAPAATMQPDAAAARVERRDAREDAAAPDEAMATGTVWPTSRAEPIPILELIPNLSASDAKSYRIRGIFAYRDGDLYRALADFDLAILRDPNYAEAYVDRGIVLYRIGQFDRAFADMTKAKRIASANRTKATVPLPAPRRTSSVMVRDAPHIAASDRYAEVPALSSAFRDATIIRRPSNLTDHFGAFAGRGGPSTGGNSFR
jgi:curved DNA-binding protein CbpA